MKARPLQRNMRLKNILPWSVLALLLGSLPYVVAWLVTPDELVFTDAVVNADDASVYISAIRQGAEGKWLFRPNFSPEVWPNVLGYIPYLAVGHLAKLLGGQHQFWFHLLRLSGNMLAILAFFFLARVAFPVRRRLQLTAWFLITFGSGLGWLVAALFRQELISLPDLFSPEWTTVTVLLGMPHFSVGLAFEVIVMGCVIQISRVALHGAKRRGAMYENRDYAGDQAASIVDQSWKWALAGALAALGLALSYPYNTVVVGLVVGVHMIYLAIRGRAIPWMSWLQTGVVVLPMFLFQLYYAVWGLLSPIWPYNAETNFIVVPGLPSIVIGFGLLGLLAIAGGWRWIRIRSNLLIPIWAVVNLLLLFTPIDFAGRFLLGLIVPVAALAAFGVEEVILPKLERGSFFTAFSKLSPTPYESLRRVIIILTVPSTLMVSLMLVRNTATIFGFPSYLPKREVKAMEWLSNNAEDEALVFAYYPTGNYLPRISASRVFVGQKFLTPNLDDKVGLVREFWSIDTSMSWRQELLVDWDVDYVYAGTFERQMALSEIDVPGEVVYDADGVTIYRFQD